MKKCTLLLLLLATAMPFSAQTNAQWQQTSGPEGGQVYNMSRNATTVFASTENGLWSSSDEGQSWQVLNPALNDHRVVSLYVKDAEILALAIKFGPNYSNDDFFFRSTDAGQTWTQQALSENPPYIGLSTNDNNASIWRDGNLLWIKSYEYLFKSEDNGISWTQIPAPQDAYFNQIAVNGAHILAYTYFANYRSDDFGANWIITQDTGYNQGLFSDGSFLLRAKNDSIFASSDFGLNWQVGPSGTLPLNNIKRIADGSLILFGSEIYRSQDGFTWQQITQSGDSNAFSTGVESGNSFLAAGASGIYHTIQNNTKFEPSQNGFIGSTIYAMATMPDGKLIASTYYEGLYSSQNNGLTWKKMQGPLAQFNYYIGFQEMIVKGDTLWGVGSNDSIYYQVGSSNVWTKNLDVDAWFGGESFFRIIGNDLYLVEDARIRRTRDGGFSWQTIVSDSATFYGLRDIAKAGNDLFFSTNDGMVFRSSDDGTSWQQICNFSTPGAHRYNKLGVIGGRLIFWSEYESFYSTDNGNTWQTLAMDGLPVDSWGDSNFAPGDIKYFQNLILCTIPYNGVWASFNQGNSWEALNNGLSNLRGRRLAISGSNIFMGASTSGVWRLGANFEVFSGKVYNDLNQNGEKDNGEPPMGNIIVSAEPLGSYTATEEDGTYSLVAASSLDSIRVGLPNAYCSVLPPSRLADQTGSGYDFGIHFTEGVVDLKLDLTNSAPFRPGFNNELTLTASNVGNETVSDGWVRLIMPHDITVLSTNQFGSVSVINDTLTWQLTALAPFESSALQMSVMLDFGTPLGELLSFEGVLQANGDVELDNNLATIQTWVVGSYDPNDKSATASITPADLAKGKPLEYTIRFENTGTFYAEKVVVRDVLEAKLNPVSFKLISSSHPCTWHLRTDGTVEFTFSNIFLLPGETGFVKFSVAADEDLTLNEVVYNTAEILFDFNAPIVTNTVKTTVSQSLSNHSPALSDFRLEVFPNPTRNLVHIVLSKEALGKAKSLCLLDQSGKQVLRLEPISEQQNIQLSRLGAGVYDLVLYGMGQKVLGREKVVLLK